MRSHGKDEGSWRAEMGAMLSLAWPLVLTNLAQSLINATDTVLLGWAGPRMLAAGALGINLYMALLIFGTGLVTAASPLMAKAVGVRASSVREVRSTVRQTMWLAFAFCVPAWILLWNSGALLRLLGQDPALAADAQRLLRTLQWGLLPALCYLVLRSFVAALERPFWSLAIMIGTIFLNAFLNYGLIFGNFGFPRLGLIGAGIGSSCANAVLFLGMAGAVSLHPRFRRYHLFGSFGQADWPRFRHVLRLGLPIAVTLGFEVGIFNAAVLLMGLIGADAIAAHVVALQIASLTFMVPLGLAQAATVRVGLAYGRRDTLAIGRAGWSAFGIGLAFMTVAAALMLAFPRPLVGLFLDPRDPANAVAYPLALSLLFVAALFQIVDGAQVVGAGMLRGLHDTRVPMAFAGFG